MVCEVVKGDQEVKRLEKDLLALLCSSKHDKYCSLTERVTSTVEARKQVGLDIHLYVCIYTC